MLPARAAKVSRSRCSALLRCCSSDEYDIKYKDARIERWESREVDEGLLPKGLTYDVRLTGGPETACAYSAESDRRGSARLTPKAARRGSPLLPSCSPTVSVKTPS